MGCISDPYFAEYRPPNIHIWSFSTVEIFIEKQKQTTEVFPHVHSNGKGPQGHQYVMFPIQPDPINQCNQPTGPAQNSSPLKSLGKDLLLVAIINRGRTVWKKPGSTKSSFAIIAILQQCPHLQNTRLLHTERGR